MEGRIGQFRSFLTPCLPLTLAKQMIDEQTQFELHKMHYTCVDYSFVLKLVNKLIDQGFWLEDFDLAVGPESKENRNIEVLFNRLCDHLELRKISKEEFRDVALVHYSKKIIEANGDHQSVMESVYKLVPLIQDDLGFEQLDKEYVGEAAGIRDFIGAYYEYEEYDYYQMTERARSEARDQDIETVTRGANKAVVSIQLRASRSTS